MWKKLSISPHSLLMDTGILVMPEFLLGKYGHDGGSLLSGNILVVVFSIFLMQAVLPLYMRKIARAYEPYYESLTGSFLEIFMKFLFGAMIFFVFVFGFVIFSHLSIENSGPEVTVIIFGAIFSLFLGYFAGDAFYGRSENADYHGLCSTVLIYVLAFVAVASAMVVIFGMMISRLSIMAGFLMIAGIAALSIGLPIIYRKKTAGISRKSFWSRHGSKAGNILLTVLLMYALALLMDIIYRTMMVNLEDDFCAAVLLLVFTGYLPFRALIEFEPPLTVLSVISGILSTGYFLFRLY